MLSLKKNLLVVSNMTRNLVNFHPTTQKSENCTSMGSFCPKYIKFELKKYRGVFFHDTEQWCQIWINPVISKMAWVIARTFIRAVESLKNWALMGSFCPKHNVSARNFQRNYVSWHWRVMQNLKEKLTHGLKNDIRNLVNFQASSRRSENLYFDRLLLSKAYKDLD